MSSIRSRALNEMVLFQRGEEFPHVELNGFRSDPKFPADLRHDFWFFVSALQKFQDFGPDKIEVEHAAMPNVEHGSAVGTMNAANAFRNSKQRVLPFPKSALSKCLWKLPQWRGELH